WARRGTVSPPSMSCATVLGASAPSRCDRRVRARRLLGTRVGMSRLLRSSLLSTGMALLVLPACIGEPSLEVAEGASEPRPVPGEEPGSYEGEAMVLVAETPIDV